MNTHKVESSKWPDCLNQFSGAHHGQEVTVETLTPSVGLRCNVRDVSLLGVAVEPDPPQFSKITVEAGDSRRGLFTHTIVNPAEIRTAGATSR